MGSLNVYRAPINTFSALHEKIPNNTLWQTNCLGKFGRIHPLRQTNQNRRMENPPNVDDILTREKDSGFSMDFPWRLVSFISGAAILVSFCGSKRRFLVWMICKKKDKTGQKHIENERFRFQIYKLEILNQIIWFFKMMPFYQKKTSRKWLMWLLGHS